MESKRSKKEQQQAGLERHDPFAVDLFGGGVKTEIQGGLKSVKAQPLPDGVSRDWHGSLETVSRGRDEGSFETPDYPDWLEVIVNERLMPSLRSLTARREARVHFEVVSCEDSSAEQVLGKLEGTGKLFVVFEFGEETGLISLSTELAGEIIDGVLSGPGNKTADLRPLSKIELAICEYVAVSALSKFNSLIDGRTHFRVLSVANEAPGTKFESARIVEIVADLLVGDLSGMVSILLPFKMADTLNDVFGKSLSNGGKFEKRAQFKDLNRETGIFLHLGSTVVPAVELPFLEAEDIVLITNPAEQWWAGGADLGMFECFAGASSNIRMKGRLELGPEAGGARFEVIEAKCETPDIIYSEIRSAKLDMEAKGLENKDLEAGTEPPTEEAGEAGTDAKEVAEDDRGLVALENVMVDLRVQVAGRKISLNDLGRIHAGQIIDLGCRPEDPVELIAESSDRPIASGELVKIEDQLGVRITKVFV